MKEVSNGVDTGLHHRQSIFYCQWAVMLVKARHLMAKITVTSLHYNLLTIQ